MNLKLSSTHRLRCFVGFFGITRGLNNVIDSIERNIFNPLEEAGVDIVRAAHLNRPTILYAPRSGEAATPFRMDDLTRLHLDHVLVEPQSDDAIATPLEEALSIPLIFEPDADGSVRRNVVRQLYSLQCLGKLFETCAPEAIDFVVIARPDLRYLHRMPLRQILARLGIAGAPGIDVLRRAFQPAAELVTPSWHQWGGLNDRFAFASPRGARTYFNRIVHLSEFCRTQPAFQGEALLKFATEQDGIRVATTWMRAERVRIDGSVAVRDVPGRKERLCRAALLPLRQALQM